MFGSPLFSWSPRPGQHQDVEASPATRTAVNGSSVYSQSPALTNYTATPKIPFRGFWSRQQSPDPNTPSVSGDAPRDAGNAALPLSPPQAHHSAGSYIGAITPSQDPEEPTTLYSRHPADVQLPPGSSNSADPETRELADEVNGRRRRRRRHRRTPRDADRREQWVRRRDERGTSQIYVKGSAARGKMVACVISGTFLIAILSIYLAFALTDRNLGQEIHILFIMVLLTITIFFCHSLIRLCMLMLNPPSEEQQRFVPNMSGAEGFQPIIPIRVHLQRDEEAAVENEEALVSENVDDPEKHMPPPPPPAYGLWRSSVRADPNLLHWQRVDQANARTSRGRRSRNSPEPRDASPEPSAPEGPRPPSYVSEDGVSYIVEAAPRSTVTSTVSRDSHTGYSEIHPAWRPGYAMSEIRSGELPIGTNSRP